MQRDRGRAAASTGQVQRGRDRVMVSTSKQADKSPHLPPTVVPMCHSPSSLQLLVLDAWTSKGPAPCRAFLPTRFELKSLLVVPMYDGSLKILTGRKKESQ